LITKAEDIPDEILKPKNWPMWRVIAYRGKSGDVHLAETFVRSSSELRAIEIGKSALRMLGVRGRYVVNASRYYPWLDRKLAGYVGFAS
jgi:hypothetical protein